VNRRLVCPASSGGGREVLPAAGFAGMSIPQRRRTMRRLAIVLALAGVLGLSGLFAAEKETAVDVEALIQKGLKAYKDGKGGEAIQALQDAIAAIQKSQEKGLAAFFPKAPAGWEAGKMESQSLSMGSSEGGTNYTVLSQAFTQGKDDNAIEVKVTLTNSPQQGEAYKSMVDTYKNPEMLKILNADAKQKITMIDQDGWVGFRHIEKESKGQIIVFHGPCMLMLDCDKDNEKALDAIWKGIDLKGLAKATPVTSQPAK
jgi:hypothetical protein